MAKISRTTAQRSAISRTMGSSVEVNCQQAGERLDALLFPDGVPARLTMAKVVKAVADLTRRNAETFEEAERVLATERSQDRRWRVVRDERFVALRQVLIKVRGAIVNVWGEYAAKDVGLVGRTPEAPEQLLSYARNVGEKVARGFEGYGVEMPQGLDLGRPDSAHLAAAIDAGTEALAGALNAVKLDERETQGALHVRDKADAVWRAHYGPAASIIEGFYRLAEMPEHADRVRPTARRRAGLVEEEDLGALGEVELGEVGEEEVGEEDVVVS